MAAQPHAAQQAQASAAPNLLASWFNKTKLSAADIIHGLTIEGSPQKHQSQLLLAKSHSKTLGSPEDVNLVGLRWFRAREGTAFDPLDVKGSALQPSVDDVGCRLCVQCYDLKDETQSHFVEFGPITLDPRTREAAAAKKISLKAVTLDLAEIFIEREADAPVTMREASQSVLIDSLQWTVAAGEPKKVVYNQRDLYFASPAERDVATLLVRSSSMPAVARSASPIDDAARIQILERDLADARLQLAATAMANKARNGAAETGKALAEATALRREVDKLSKDNANLAKEVAQLRTVRVQLDTDLNAALERERQRGDVVRERDQALALVETLKQQLREAQERAERAERTGQDAKDSVPKLKARAETAEKRTSELEEKLAAALAEAEKANSRRNAAQNKAESLGKDMARLLRATPGGLEEVEEIVRQNHALSQQLEEARNELRQARAAVPSIPTGKASSASSSSSGKASKDRELGTLANSLMAEVKEKDEALEALRAENNMLNLRLRELQKHTGGATSRGRPVAAGSES